MTPSLSEKDEQLNREIPSPAIIKIAAAGRNANQPSPTPAERLSPALAGNRRPARRRRRPIGRQRESEQAENQRALETT